MRSGQRARSSSATFHFQEQQATRTGVLRYESRRGDPSWGWLACSLWLPARPSTAAALSFALLVLTVPPIPHPLAPALRFGLLPAACAFFFALRDVPPDHSSRDSKHHTTNRSKRPGGPTTDRTAAETKVKRVSRPWTYPRATTTSQHALPSDMVLSSRENPQHNQQFKRPAARRRPERMARRKRANGAAMDVPEGHQQQPESPATSPDCNLKPSAERATRDDARAAGRIAETLAETKASQRCGLRRT